MSLTTLSFDKAPDLRVLPRVMFTVLLLSNFSHYGTAALRGWFDVATR